MKVQDAQSTPVAADAGIGDVGLPFPLVPVAWFWILGIATTTLGLLDATGALGLPYRILGLLWLVAGLVMLAAGFCLARASLRPSWGLFAGKLASAVSSLLGLYLLISTLQAPGEPRWRRLAVWYGIVLFSLFVGGLLFRLQRLVPKSIREAPRQQGGPATLVRTLTSLGVSGGLLVSFFQFWYSNQLLPEEKGAVLTTVAKVTPVGVAEGVRFFSVDLTVDNPGVTKVQVLSSQYRAIAAQVRGSAKDGEEVAAEVFKPRAGQGPVDDSATASRHTDEFGRQIVQFGKPVPDLFYFEPQEQYNNVFVVGLPQDQVYDLLRIEMEFFIAKGSRLVVDLQPDAGARPIEYPGQRYVVSEYDLRPISRMSRLVRGEQTLKFMRLLQADYLNATEFATRMPFLEVCIDQRGRMPIDPRRDWTHVCPDSSERLHSDWQDHYGMGWTTSTAELALTSQEMSQASAGP